MPELLSICIPTYNRAQYLRPLLEGLIGELEQTLDAVRLTRLYISDNQSSDETAEVVKSFAGRWPLIYNRNEFNIGGDQNFALMIDRAPGTYFWLLGDDELIIPGFLTPLLEILRAEKHGLILLETVTEAGERYGYTVPQEPGLFSNYAEFVGYYRKAYPWKLMLHSFISMMVVKRACYDQETARRMLGTIDRHYAHMYGVVEGLSSHPASIYLQRQPSVRIRDARALVDTSLLRLTYLWWRYYRWLAKKFGHADLKQFGRSLYGWQKRWQLIIENLQTAIGKGPRLMR